MQPLIVASYFSEVLSSLWMGGHVTIFTGFGSRTITFVGVKRSDDV